MHLWPSQSPPSLRHHAMTKRRKIFIIAFERGAIDLQCKQATILASYVVVLLLFGAVFFVTSIVLCFRICVNALCRKVAAALPLAGSVVCIYFGWCLFFSGRQCAPILCDCDTRGKNCILDSIFRQIDGTFT